MKLSRRGKHTKRARRGRHTKHAGKKLRYKSKKFRASKRYHRGGNRYTKKLYGRRVKKGGGVTFQEMTTTQDQSDPSKTIYTVQGTTGTGTITYKKTGTIMSDYSEFDITITVKSKSPTDASGTIILTRKKSPRVTYDTSEYTLKKIIKKEKYNTEISGFNADTNVTANYDFSFTENMDDFNAIVEKISSIREIAKQQEKEKETKKKILMQQQENDKERLKAEQEQLKKQAIEEFDKNGDDLEVLMHYQTSEPFSQIKDNKEMKLKFSDFKQELEELAKKTKENIATNQKIGLNEKKDRSDQVDGILKSELHKQRFIMGENYIAEKAGYDIKQSIGGKMSLLDQTSNRVKENLKSREKIIDQANEDSLDWNDYDRQTGVLTPKPRNNTEHNNTKTVSLTSEQDRFYDHYGMNTARLDEPASGLTIAEMHGQPF